MGAVALRPGLRAVVDIQIAETSSFSYTEGYLHALIDTAVLPPLFHLQFLRRMYPVHLKERDSIRNFGILTHGPYLDSRQGMGILPQLMRAHRVQVKGPHLPHSLFCGDNGRFCSLILYINLTGVGELLPALRADNRRNSQIFSIIQKGFLRRGIFQQLSVQGKNQIPGKGRFLISSMGLPTLSGADHLADSQKKSCRAFRAVRRIPDIFFLVPQMRKPFHRFQKFPLLRAVSVTEEHHLYIRIATGRGYLCQQGTQHAVNPGLLFSSRNSQDPAAF